MRLGGLVPPLLYEDMMWYNLLFGGKADKSKPGDFDPRELQRGRAVEREHTRDGHLQTEIAMDHLKEDPEYYKKLQYVEKKTVPFIQKMLKEYDAKKKLEKRASLRDLVGNYPARFTIGGAIAGAGVGLATAPKEDRVKRTLRSALYGAAAGIGASERLAPALEKTYQRMQAQRSLIGRIKARKLRSPGTEQEHFNRLRIEDRPTHVPAIAVGGSAGLGLTDLGLNAMRKVREKAELESAQAKKKKRQIVYIR